MCSTVAGVLLPLVVVAVASAAAVVVVGVVAVGVAVPCAAPELVCGLEF